MKNLKQTAMRNNSLLKFNKPDFLFMVAVFAVIIYSGIFYMSNLLFIGLAVALAVIVYTFAFRRGFKKLGISLMVIGIALVFTLPANWAWSSWQKRGLAAEFEQQVENFTPPDPKPYEELPWAAKVEQLKQRALDYKEKLQTGQTIAQVEIPKIGVSSIIVEGTEESELMKGPGHIEETPIPGLGGNFAVAGDRVLYGAPFLNLDDVQVGDEIRVKTPYGKLVYEVIRTFKVTPDDVSVLQPDADGNEIITLITCDPPWDVTRRLIVQAKVTKIDL